MWFISVIDPDVTYEDDERVEICKKLLEYDQQKDKIINSEELLGDEKIKEHFAVFDVSIDLNYFTEYNVFFFLNMCKGFLVIYFLKFSFPGHCVCIHCIILLSY